MASIFRSVTISYRNPQGHKCEKSASGAIKVRIPAKVYSGRFKDSTGRRKTVALCASKTNSKEMLAKLVTDAKMARLNLTDKFEKHRSRPLSEHVADFRRFLEAKGNTEKHSRQTCKRVQTILDRCRFILLADLSPSTVVEWLAGERQANRLGIQTSNYYLRDLKSFCRWLVKDGRTGRNPIAHLSGMNAKTETHLERRSLLDDEFAKFILATQKGGTVRGLNANDRAMLYLMAANSGFRAGELASLTPESFGLNSDPPCVTVEAAYSKRRRQDNQPLRKDLAALVRNWLREKPAKKRLWPGGWVNHAAKMVRVDLKAAGIVFRDETGRVFDFHGLRHQFISKLAAGGVHPKVAQVLARHSTITLTMDRYTHLGLLDQTEALEKLPALPSPSGEQESLAATGTDLVRTRFVQIISPQGFSGDVRPSHDEERSEKANCDDTLKMKAFATGCDRLRTGDIEKAPPGFEPGMADLQSAALPLG